MTAPRTISTERQQRVRGREWSRLSIPAATAALVWIVPPDLKQLLLMLYPLACLLWICSGLTGLPNTDQRLVVLALATAALVPMVGPLLQLALVLTATGTLYALEHRAHHLVAWRLQLRGSMFSYLIICHLSVLGFMLNPYT